MTTTLPLSDLLNSERASEILGVKKGTLAIWRTTGRYDLKFVKVGRRVFYRHSDLQAWLSARTQMQTQTE